MKYLLLAVLLMSANVSYAQDVGLEIGAKPAAITLEDLDGKAVDLGKYMGKRPVLLEFWATWCPLCRALEPQLNAAKKQYKNLQVVVVAVGVNQTPRSIKRHLTKHTLPGIVLWDGKGAAVREFMAPGTSYVVLLDKQGRVVYTGAGSEQKLLPVLAKLN
jgi:thiol-disulfide isomerase/thioredoxin